MAAKRAEGYNRLSGTLRCTCYRQQQGCDPSGSDSIDSEGKNRMLLTGAEIVVECLKEQGVDTVFGYPGGAILNVYDALYKHSDEIRHVLTSHEQGASHAADGYARTT